MKFKDVLTILSQVINISIFIYFILVLLKLNVLNIFGLLISAFGILISLLDNIVSALSFRRTK